ncbi:MAG: hypothetical protein O2782_01445 [bacterium]|nr:hypothetical protein [bacterium]
MSPDGSLSAERLQELRPMDVDPAAPRAPGHGESAPNDERLEEYGLTPAHVALAARRLLD